MELYRIFVSVDGSSVHIDCDISLLGRELSDGFAKAVYIEGCSKHIFRTSGLMVIFAELTIGGLSMETSQTPSAGAPSPCRETAMLAATAV